MLVAALGHLGRAEESKIEAEVLLQHRSDFSCQFLKEQLPLVDTKLVDRFCEGLRKAGVPES